MQPKPRLQIGWPWIIRGSYILLLIALLIGKLTIWSTSSTKGVIQPASSNNSATNNAIRLQEINAVRSTSGTGGVGNGTWLPEASDNVGPLSGIAAVAPDDVWAVGKTLDEPSKALALHWDGTSWASKFAISPEISVLGDAYFKDVYAASQDDVWAVGGIKYTSVGGATFLLAHWNGTGWSTISSLGLNTQIGELNAIDGSGPDDIWVVGANLFALHWNGSKWTSESTVDATGYGAALVGIDDISPDDVWAAGGNKILHWDGTSWIQMYKGDQQTFFYGAGFRDIAMQSATNGWVIGSYVAPTDSSPSVLYAMHWDGKSWGTANEQSSDGSNTYTLCFTPFTVGSDACIAGGLTAITPNNVWAVGGQGIPVVAHWDGTDWIGDECAGGSYMGIVSQGIWSYSVRKPGYGGPLSDVAEVQPGVLWGVGQTADGMGYVLDLQHGPCPTPLPTYTPPPTPTIDTRPRPTAPPPQPSVPAAVRTDIPYAVPSAYPASQEPTQVPPQLAYPATPITMPQP